MGQPAVSVIVAVYNVEHYVAACLDSLVGQTFSDFEVILVDDGSTDGSRAIIDQYAEAHPELFRVVSRPNGGLAAARNQGIDAARGAYLAFVDGDDIVEPVYLSEMYSVAVDTGADFVICGIRGFTDPSNPAPYIREPDMSVFGTHLSDEPRLLFRVDASACDKLFTRDLFERSGVRFPLDRAFEDLPTVFKLLAHARVVAKVDAPLYLYRQGRVGSITAGYGERFLDLVRGLEDVLAFYEGRGEFATYRSALLRLSLTHLIAGRYPDLYLRATAEDRDRFIRSAFDLLDRRFAGWRREQVCRDLWPNPVLRRVSTRRTFLRAFAALPERWYLRFLSKMGAFDPSR